MAIVYRGERFSGYNKPKRTPKASKSHAVLAKQGDKVNLLDLVNKVYLVQVKKLMLNLKLEESLLKQDTLRTSKKEKCLQLTGLIKLNGKCSLHLRKLQRSITRELY